MCLGLQTRRTFLIEVVLKRLEIVIKKTRSTLWDISRDAYKAFKKVNTETAKNNMEDAVKTANNETKQRTENRIKRNLEAARGRPAKKSRDN